MTDRPDFEMRLAERLRVHAAHASRPFDAVAIAREAVAIKASPAPRRRSGRWRGFTLLAAAALIGTIAWSTAGGSRFLTPPPDPSVIPTRLPALVPPPSPVATHRLAHNGAIAVSRENAIALIDPLTGEAVKSLPTASGRAWELTWAPDGMRLAFTSTGGVWVMDVSNGASAQILTCGEGPDGCTIAWAPDGSRIAVAHGGVLELVDPDGSNPATLFEQKQPPGHSGLSEPTWSPDSTRIAFNAWIGGKRGLYSINRDGSGVAPLLAPVPGIGTFDPAWSPDGSSIVYFGSTDIRVCRENKFTKTTSCDEEWQLQVMSLALDGSEPRALHEAGICYCLGFAPSLSWSPDGTRIAFLGSRGDSFPGGLTVMNADGTGLRQVTPDDDGPAWQPVPTSGQGT